MKDEMFYILGDIVDYLHNVDYLIPSKEDTNNILKKLDNNEELDFYDLLVLDRIRFCNHIINLKGGRI